MNFKISVLNNQLLCFNSSGLHAAQILTRVRYSRSIRKLSRRNKLALQRQLKLFSSQSL